MRIQRAFWLVVFWSVVAVIAQGAGYAAALFTEDFETGAASWTLESPWAVTDEDAHGATHCLTDSPGANYANSADKKATVPVDLTGSNRPLLSFWNRYNLEDNKDYGYVEVSKDAGATWECLFFITGDSAMQWYKEEMDLSPYANRQVHLRFRIKTDASGQREGWHIDDIDISENAATTAVPFSDDAETASSDGRWIASSWERIASDGHNSTSCWSRPAFTVRSDLATALVLRGTMDFGGSGKPQLSFWHHKSGSGDVYLSSDGGQTWTRIYHDAASWTDWRKTQIDLSAQSGLSNIAVKFTMANGSRWRIDDVLVSDAPQSVSLQPLTEVGEHSMTLTWSQNADADFASYWIYRSMNANMSSAVEIASITDRATTTYADTDLTFVATFYYYRVYVVDTEDLRDQGSNVQGAKTLLGATTQVFPFTDDMESGDTWGNDWPWDLTNADSHSGAYCWTDSPGTSYENNMDRSLLTAIDLTGSNRPLLSFWNRYNLEDNKDFGYVEVSKDAGATWSGLFFRTGNSATQWFKEEIDLSPYADKQIQLAFRIKTDASGQRDGWYIDDVEVSENPAVAAFPFSDDAEGASSDNNWIASSWERIATDGHDSAHCWSRPATTRSDLSIALVLRGRIDLSAVVNPQLSFWHHKNGTGDVYISADGGHTWTQIYHNTSNWTDWRKTDVDLATHAGLPNVALKFTMVYGQLWNIDDVEITGESVVRPILTPYIEAGVAKLSWTAFGAGSYTVEWSEDLNVWIAEPGMPITDTVFSLGEIPALPKHRFYRVFCP